MSDAHATGSDVRGGLGVGKCFGIRASPQCLMSDPLYPGSKSSSESCGEEARYPLRGWKSQFCKRVARLGVIKLWTQVMLSSFGNAMKGFHTCRFSRSMESTEGCCNIHRCQSCSVLAQYRTLLLQQSMNIYLLATVIERIEFQEASLCL